MVNEFPDFRPLLEALQRNHVRFVLIGGVAMSAHGSAHVTFDLDVGYSRDSENIQSMRRALAGLHPRLRGFPPYLPFVWDERTIQNAANMTLDTDETPLDILGDIPGVDSFKGLWERPVVTEVYGLSVHVASIADLIVMKRTANRLKDQNHILELLALQKLIENKPAPDTL